MNGKRLSAWEWDSYRQLVGYVPQEGVLFSKSIEENVAFGREAPEDFAVPYSDSEAALRAKAGQQWFRGKDRRRAAFAELG